jgi:hypothetical protein
MQEQANALYVAVSVFKVAGGNEGTQSSAAKRADKSAGLPAVAPRVAGSRAASAVVPHGKERRKERRLAATKEVKEEKEDTAGVWKEF